MERLIHLQQNETKKSAHKCKMLLITHSTHMTEKRTMEKGKRTNELSAWTAKTNT